MAIKIIDVNLENFDSIPRPANRSFNCQECFYWMEKRDGRANLVNQKKKWLAKREKKCGGPLCKVALWGVNQKSVGFIQFGPISEYKTTSLIYRDRLSVPKGTWCISCVAIQTPYRKKGVATRLVRSVLRDIKSRGAKTVDVYPAVRANSWNQVSIGPVNLWKKCGFKEVCEIECLKGEPALCSNTMVLMRKEW